MTPTEKLMQKAIHICTDKVLTDAAAVRERYEQLFEQDDNYDALCELRASGTPTGLPCDYSRHYESKAVAAEMLDGSWVGWTYWYGGGKHGEPGAMPWMEDAYDVTTEVVMEPVRKFRKVGG